MTSTAGAYSDTGGAWDRGPARVYDRLARVMVGRSPVPLKDGRILDVGAGTGAGSRAARAVGAAQVVAVDAAFGMLAHESAARPPAVLGDALALPFGAATFDATLAAFSLNHLTSPAAGLLEMARVTRVGGAIMASSYAADDSHPVKDAVTAALTARGWTPPAWYTSMSQIAAPRLATPERCAEAARAAKLDANVEAVRVPFPDLGAADLVAWRLGLAQHAPFVAGLGPDERTALELDARSRLEDNLPPLVRSILLLTAVMR